MLACPCMAPIDTNRSIASTPDSVRPEAIKMGSDSSQAERVIHRWWSLLAGLSVTLAVLAVYAGSLNMPFVFDDRAAITENPTIRDLSSLGAVLSPPHGSGLTVEGRPILNLSLAINYALGGTRPDGYRLFNVLIHIAAALLLFGIVRRALIRSRYLAPKGAARLIPSALTPNFEEVGRARVVAFAVALLWAVHPLQTESVTYVIQRAESLVSLFYLFTLYGFVRATETKIRGRMGGWYALSVGACLLGMATKEIMYSAPMLVLLYDRTFVAGSFSGAWRQRPRYYFFLASTWLLLAGLMIGTGNRGGTAGFGISVTPWTYAKTEFQAVVQYLWLCAWPHPLIFDYGVRWAHGAREILPYAFIVAGLVAVTAHSLIKRAPAGLLGFWFFAVLAPTSSFVPGNRQTLAEHRMYLPLAAVIIAAAVGGHRLLAGRKPNQPSVIAAASGLAALALAFAALSARRNEDYRSELVLYADTVAKRPGNAFARYNFGRALNESGAIDASIVQYREAIRLDPSHSAPRNNLGKALADRGLIREAIDEYAVALRLRPDYPLAHYNLGEAMLRLGQNEEALREFAKVVDLQPDDVEARDNLGGLLLQLGHVQDAITQFQIVLKIDPKHFETHYMLGNALRLSGRPAEAVAHYEQALQLKPDFIDARRNLELARREAAGAP